MQKWYETSNIVDFSRRNKTKLKIMNDNRVLIFLLKRFKKVVKFCADSFLSHVEIQFNLIKAQVILTANMHMHDFNYALLS